MMPPETGYRFVAFFVALVVGVGGVLFLLGPVLFGGAEWLSLSIAARVGALACAVLGFWFALVAVLLSNQQLERVLAPLQGGEVALLFLPYMLYFGTRALFERWRDDF